MATGENLTGLEQFAPLFDRGAVDIVQVGCVWGVTHFLRVAYAAHSRDLPISPVGLTANPAVAHAAAAVPNHLSSEVQDLGSPFGISIDQQFVDGGVVLGDLPGNGITIDEDAIVANQRTGSWAASGGRMCGHTVPVSASSPMLRRVQSTDEPGDRRAVDTLTDAERMSAGAADQTTARLIDSHVHIWDPTVLEYSWLEGELDRPYLPAEYQAGAPATTGVIFVEAGRGG